MLIERDFEAPEDFVIHFSRLSGSECSFLCAGKSAYSMEVKGTPPGLWVKANMLYT